ncbi:MAG: hypothetical protein LUH40_02110 [Clostridiales bacterium]|nr:hypothetical protein [Clostridiales bacterium]
MNISELKSVIDERIRNCDELQDNWNYGIEQCWKRLIDVLSENISETIDFILNSCSDEELFWISEVFEDIAEQTQSKEFTEALRRRLERVTRENYRQENFKSKLMRDEIDFDEFQRSVSEEIENAEAKLKQ